MTQSCLIICHYGFQELILSSTQRRSFETAISKRRLLCLSVRYLGTMRARTLRYPSPTWAMSCTFPTDDCIAAGNSQIPTRRLNKIRYFNGSPFISVLHELGRPARSSPRMPFRSFPHSANHFLIRGPFIMSAPCTCHLSVNFNGANMLCLYKPNHTTNYQHHYQCTMQVIP